MKFTALKENLQKALSLVQRIVLKNPSLPILENVLLEIKEKQLKVSATNLEVGIHIWVKGKVEKEGKLTVPAPLLGNVVANVKEERILLEGKGLDIKLKTESFEGLIKGQDPSDFPLIPKPEPSKTCTLEVDEISQGLSQVVPVIIISEIYPEISGLFISFSKNKLTLVGTDSFRLAKKELLLKDQKECASPSFILPLKSSQELLFILEQYQGNRFSVGATENQVLFSFDDIELVSRLLVGNYPNYQELIPREFVTSAEVGRQDFIEKVKLTSVFSPKTNDCKVELLNSSLKLSSSVSGGFSESVLKARIRGSGAKELVFNYRYLLDGLLSMKTKEVVFQIKNEASPVLFRGIGDESYIYLVAPLKS